MRATRDAQRTQLLQVQLLAVDAEHGPVGLDHQFHGDIPSARPPQDVPPGTIDQQLIQTGLHCAIQVFRGVLVTGTTSASIDQEQGFSRVGQRDQQGMVSPLPLIVDIHAPLTLTEGFHHRAIGIDQGFIKEVRSLFLRGASVTLIENSCWQSAQSY